MKVDTVKLFNAITAALREMEKYPEDSAQDIWNEYLEQWDTGLRLNHALELEPVISRSLN